MSQVMKDAIVAELKRRGMTMYELSKALERAGDVSAARSFYKVMSTRHYDSLDAAAKHLGLRVVPGSRSE